jgi:ketose-bisphosphate aldolase
MITAFSALLGDPRGGRAVGAFTAYDLETGIAILRAAEQRGGPVILLVSRAALAGPRGEALVAALHDAAKRAAVPVCLQLDHVADEELIALAAELGCGAVMADGSRLAFEPNVKLVALAAAIVGASGGEVEGELGHLAGGEDVARAARAEGLTDPDLVADFAARSGAVCLAVSIGNVHGAYAEPPRLDWERLAAIRGCTDLHLSLHGASGLADEDIARAVAAGITKVNVNLELRQAYVGATAAALAEDPERFDLLALHDRQMAAVEAAAGAKIDLLGGLR